MKHLIGLFFTLFLIQAPHQLIAEAAAAFSNEDKMPTPIEGLPEIPSFQALFIKTVVLLIFVVLALTSFLWILKRLQNNFRKTGRQKETPHIELVERVHLSSKTVIWYTRVDGFPHLIVEGQHGVAISRAQRPLSNYPLSPNPPGSAHIGRKDTENKDIEDDSPEHD